MKTIMPKQLSNEQRNWYLIDAKGLTLGRLSTKVADLLSGKKKLDFARHLDNGDYVVIINADKFNVTGKKLSDKIYYKHSGFLGGLKETSLEKTLEKKPTKALELSVKGMLPKNKLRSSMISRLRMFATEEHTHVAQNPEIITL